MGGLFNRHTMFIWTLTAWIGLANSLLAQSDEELKRQAALALGLGRATRPGTPQLVQAASIQRDLQLTAAQVAQVRGLENRIKLEMRKQFGEEKRKASLKIAREYKEVGDRLLQQEILTPEQYGRLKQIILQMEIRNQGLIMIYTLEKWDDKLEFSSEQRAALAKERQAFDKALVQAMREQGSQKLRMGLDGFLKTSDARIMGLLNPEQRKEWNEAVGKPFDFSTATDLPIRR